MPTLELILESTIDHHKVRYQRVIVPRKEVIELGEGKRNQYRRDDEGDSRKGLGELTVEGLILIKGSLLTVKQGKSFPSASPPTGVLAISSDCSNPCGSGAGKLAGNDDEVEKVLGLGTTTGFVQGDPS